jgi:hypothetical protein
MNKNTERIQDTIFSILHASFDICLKTLPAIFDNLYVTTALFDAFCLLHSSTFRFYFVAGPWPLWEFSQKSISLLPSRPVKKLQRILNHSTHRKDLRHVCTVGGL